MVGVVRDILIIFLALTSIVVWVLLGILIWQIWRLTKLVQSELKPMILDTKETIATVRGTTAFMSENVVTPVIQTSSRVAGYRRTVMALFGQLPSTPTPARSSAAAFTTPTASAPPAESGTP